MIEIPFVLMTADSGTASIYTDESSALLVSVMSLGGKAGGDLPN